MFQVKEPCNKVKTYKIPEFLGHTIAKPSPSLSPFRQTKENHFLADASGVAPLLAQTFSAPVSSDVSPKHR